METKFNFYDFVGYIIPGAILFIIAYWFLKTFFGIIFNIEKFELISTLVFISVSYFLGHLLQGIGSFFTNRRKTSREGLISTKKYSCDFLKIESNYYSNEFKNEIKNKIKEFFSIDLFLEGTDEKRISEAFNLCYTLIIQENIAIHTDIFNGFYSFFRGLKITTFIGLIVSLLTLLEQLLLHYKVIQNLLSVTFNITSLVFSIILLIFFIISYFISKYRCDDFSKHFANSVYRSFLVYCNKLKV